MTNQKTELGLVSLYTFLEGKVETGPSGGSLRLQSHWNKNSSEGASTRPAARYVSNG